MGSNSEPSAPLQAPLVAREIIVGVTATLLFFLSVVMIPVFGIVLGTFTPLPTLLAYYRWGSPQAFWVPGIASLLGYALLAYLNVSQSLPYLMEMLLLGLLIGLGMRRGWSPERTVGAAGALVFAAGALVFWFSYGGGNEGSMMVIERDLQATINMILQQYGASSSDKQLVEETLQKMLPFMLRLLPGAALSSTLMACWLNLLVARRYCRARNLPLPAWQEWSHWKAPEPVVWIVIGSGILLLLPYGFLKIAGLNVLMVAGVIYLFQGLAIVSYYSERWKLPRIFRAAVYGIILIQQFFTLGAMLLGLFDTWFDFRRLSRGTPASP
jgi:uncharacterized protein YybS (DUF2232 family)